MSNMKKINFVSKTMGGDLKLSGLLYLPEDFNQEKKYPTIVFSQPFNQVKEQMGSFYGKIFADMGYVFLTFDHQGYGESEGQLRNYEYFPSKLEGIQDAVSYLCSQDFVDQEKLYGIGACAGATHMAYVSLTDKRIKKVAFVSGMLANTSINFIFTKKKELEKILKSSNQARQNFYESNKQIPFDALKMDEAQDSKIQDVKEGYDYYMTKRAGKETYKNYSHKTLEFFAEDSARYSARTIARYITTPTITIYGSKASTKLFSWLFNFSKKGIKRSLSIKGASHVDLYDNLEYVNKTINAIDNFFKAEKYGCK